MQLVDEGAVKQEDVYDGELANLIPQCSRQPQGPFFESACAVNHADGTRVLFL